MKGMRLVSLAAVLAALSAPQGAFAQEARTSLAIGSPAPKADVAMKGVAGKGVRAEGAPVAFDGRRVVCFNAPPKPRPERGSNAWAGAPAPT